MITACPGCASAVDLDDPVVAAHISRLGALQSELTAARSKLSALQAAWERANDKALGYETRSAFRDELERLLDEIAREP